MFLYYYPGLRPPLLEQKGNWGSFRHGRAEDRNYMTTKVSLPSSRAAAMRQPYKSSHRLIAFHRLIAS